MQTSTAIADDNKGLSPLELQEAFASFTQLSTNLEASYGALKDRVAELTEELSRAREERDEEARRSAELVQLLAQNERLSAMGRMAASLAHQIRTPLAGAMLYCSEAQEQQGPRANQLLVKGMERLHELDRLVRDMLEFARGQGHHEPVRVSDLFREVWAQTKPTIPRDCYLVFDGRDTLSLITGNRSALVAALVNLVSNAFQIGGPGTVVSLSARERGKAVELSVQDNGPGVAPAMRARVFEPFFSTRSAGTGLGLAVVKSVTEAHGGKVALSESEAGGANFGIALPVAEQAR